MARLSHPNIVQIHEIGVWEGRVFIAMELVVGRTLAAFVQAPGRRWQEIVAAFVEAGRGLAAAHAVGVIHRDFKPENVLVGDDGRVRVTDFGLARGGVEATNGARTSGPIDPATGDPVHDDFLTTTHTIAGTPAYMAPEQFLGEPATAASDQFSLCVALYHALHGMRPFAGEDRAALMASVLAGALQEPARVRIPRRIHRALVRGLARDPQGRFPSMDALLAAIDPRSRWSGRRLAVLIAVGGLGLGGVGVALSRLGDDPGDASSETSSAPLIAERPPCEAVETRFEVPDAETPFRVPAGCDRVHVRAWGGGGGGAMHTGGGGGYVEAILLVDPGRELVVAVGSGGGHWNIGGVGLNTGGAFGGHGGYAGASSGGFSGVREGQTWLLVAGGGGGGGLGGEGGGGGGPRGGDGLPGNSLGGRGGTPEAPGNGGRALHGGDRGEDGRGLQGGRGGGFSGVIFGDADTGVGGGGGGGGYFAGGGGGADGWGARSGGISGGGGGGSGYVKMERTVADSIVLQTAAGPVPSTEDPSGAGHGGAGRQPIGSYRRDEIQREATSGSPGLVIVSTSPTSS